MISTAGISDTANRLIDPIEVAKVLRLMMAPGQVVEVRALEATIAGGWRRETISGYFDDQRELVRALAAIQQAKGIYFTLNPVNVALLSRAANRIRPANKDPLTADHDIIGRRYLPIDCDPVRPAGISSSEDEHAEALAKAVVISDYLASRGWPEPIIADSGNGAHLIYRIDLAADDGGLVQRCLGVLAQTFDGPRVTIDRKVFNPARIWKVYGTVAAKGDDTYDRPHRMARIMEAPAELQVAGLDLLEALAAEAKPANMDQSRQATVKPAGRRFAISDWIVSNNLHAKDPVPWNGGRKWVLTVCPFNSDHTNSSAFIIEMPSGAISAGCHHNGCAGKGWSDLRRLYEPEYYPQPNVAPTDAAPERLVDLASIDGGKLADGLLTDIMCGKSVVGIPTGEAWLDRRLNADGLEPGCFLIYHARSNVGKSTINRWMLERILETNPKIKILLFDAEQKAMATVFQMAARKSGLSVKAFYRGLRSLDSGQIAEAELAMQAVAENIRGRLFISTDTDFTPFSMDAVIAAVNPSIIVLDDLQAINITGGDSNTKDSERMTWIARHRREGRIVIGIAHRRKAASSSDDPLETLLGNSLLGYRADVVLAVSLDGEQTPGGLIPLKIECDKNRIGPRGWSVNVMLDGNTSSIQVEAHGRDF